jgi:hypothetical protein
MMMHTKKIIFGLYAQGTGSLKFALIIVRAVEENNILMYLRKFAKM